jgi:hypothetical protein
MSKTARINGAVCVVAMSIGSIVTGCSSSSGAPTDTSAAGSAGSGGSGGSGASSGLPDCKSSGKAAFATYGETAFVAVNKSIFANVNAEVTKNGTKNLGDSFTLIGTGKPASTADDAATFEGKLAAFLVFAYGGPDSITYTDGKKYSGSAIDITKAHTGLAITMDQYDYFVMNVVVPALTSNGVPTADVSSCFAPVITSTAFVDEVVGH